MSNICVEKEQYRRLYDKYYHLTKEHILFEQIRDNLAKRNSENTHNLERCLKYNQKQRDAILGQDEELAKFFLIYAHEDKEVANYELYYKLNQDNACQEEAEERFFYITSKTQDELSNQIQAFNIIINSAARVLTREEEPVIEVNSDFVQ